jgi:predicted nuclease of restriction endonuclease-like (RecB) superfamily
MADDSLTTACLTRVREILAQARHRALQSVNAAMVAAYWHIGREIVEEEQRGQSRAEYGERLIRDLSAHLTAEFGKGFSVSNLFLIRQFYQTYAVRSPEILYSPSRESATLAPPEGSAPLSAAESVIRQAKGFLPELSWTHYRILMRVQKPEARSFYEVECARARWSVRELERQIASLLWERLALSRDKEGLLELAEQGHAVNRPEDLIKDPYVLEFTGFPEPAGFQESELESVLIERLQQFLLELGRDLFFVARQNRLTLDGDHFYIDLVFYHRTLRCIVGARREALDASKVEGKPVFVGTSASRLASSAYDAARHRPDAALHRLLRGGRAAALRNPPVGLILCTDKNDAVVRYTLGQNARAIFASRYQLHLPTEEELTRELRQEWERLRGEAVG